MTQVATFSGVIPPVMTPFTADLAPDKERFVAHCQWLLDQGATGLAPFGTTGEANSLSVGRAPGASRCHRRGRNSARAADAPGPDVVRSATVCG